MSVQGVLGSRRLKLEPPKGTLEKQIDARRP